MSHESSIDWGKGIESLSEKSLGKLSSQELLNYQSRLIKAIERREFLITDRGYDTVVTSTKQTIARLENEILEFLEAREDYPDQISRLKRQLSQCREQMIKHSTKRKEQKSHKPRELSSERISRIKSKHGLSDEILSQMKALGVDPSLVIQSLA